MAIYKAQDGTLHERDAKFAHMLPDGCVELTQVEADDALNPPPTPEQAIEAVRAARARAMPDKGDVIDAICKYIESGDRVEFDAIQVLRNDVKAGNPFS